MKFKCDDCKSLLNTTKKIRKCPLCKSKNVAEEKVVETPKPVESNDFSIRPIRDNTQMRQIVNEHGKKQGIIQQVNPDEIRAKGNLFEKMDEFNDYKNETEEFTKKVKFTVGPRNRRFSLVKCKCKGGCNREFEINPAFVRDEWMCDQCIKRRIGR